MTILGSVAGHELGLLRCVFLSLRMPYNDKRYKRHLHVWLFQIKHLCVSRCQCQDGLLGLARKGLSELSGKRSHHRDGCSGEQETSNLQQVGIMNLIDIWDDSSSSCI